MQKFGISDEEFIRGKVPMTKAEIRAMVMVKAGIEKNSRVADIGAGTGSISIEAALAASEGEVYSIERNPEGIHLIEENAKKFGCHNIHAIRGTAPEAMDQLPEKLDVIIIGGSSGNMHEILHRSEELLTDKGRIVLTAVTAETTAEIVKEFADRPFKLDGFQMQINRLRKLGRYHLYNPISPVFIFIAERI